MRKTAFLLVAGIVALLSIRSVTDSGSLVGALILALFGGAVITGALLMGRRAVPIFGFVISIPFGVVYHLTYVPDHLGTSNGLMVEATDLWAIWLVMEYAHARWTGTLKHTRGIIGLCLPMVLLLLADTFSLAASTDLTLSLYGLVYHIKLAVIFLIFVLTISQGRYELKAAIAGLSFAVIAIGGICVIESILGVNFTTNENVQEMTANSIFRSAGLNTPTLTAGYLAALLPIIFMECLTVTGSKRLFSFVALCLGIAGMATTLTRGAWIVFLFGSIPLIVHLHQRRSIHMRHAILCVAAAAIIYGSLGDKIVARLNEGGENANERWDLMRTALNMAAAHPVVGAGLNTYELHMYEATAKEDSQEWVFLVHNEYAMTLAETGPLGLLALLWIVLGSLLRAWKVMRLRMPVGVGLLCSMIIVSLDMSIEGYAAGPIRLNTWTLVAIVAGVWSSNALTTQSLRRQGMLTPYV